jgi:enoyl-CoA hydratase/carnithine racemase
LEIVVSSKYITYSVEGPVALIGINRRDKRNAISQAMLRELYSCVTKAGDEVDVGLIYSHNEFFSAGLDLRELVETLEAAAPPPRKRHRKISHHVVDAIGRGPIPFVSAISGVCIGLGFEIAAATHIRVADETAYFGLPESQRGMFVGAGGSVNIQRLVGYSRMCDMMLTGRLLRAVDAERIGLVHYLTDPGEHLQKAKAVAAQIATNAPMSSWAVTNMLPRIGYLPHNDALFMEELANANVRGAGSVERLRAFLDKRTPRLVPANKKDQ